MEQMELVAHPADPKGGGNKMKKPYASMEVKQVGAISNIVNKSGTYLDISQNFEGKTFDAGGGQEGRGRR